MFAFSAVDCCEAAAVEPTLGAESSKFLLAAAKMLSEQSFIKNKLSRSD